MQPALAQVGEHPLRRLGDREAGVALAGMLGHARVEADDLDLGEVVPPSDLEVVRVVRRSHLQRAGPDRGVDVLVGDDGHLALDQRDDRAPADQLPVTLVAGVHRDRRVAEQRHGPDRGDRHVTAADERVVDVVHDVLDVAVLDLEIRDRGEAAPGDQLIIRLSRNR